MSSPSSLTGSHTTTLHNSEIVPPQVDTQAVLESLKPARSDIDRFVNLLPDERAFLAKASAIELLEPSRSEVWLNRARNVCVGLAVASAGACWVPLLWNWGVAPVIFFASVVIGTLSHIAANRLQQARVEQSKFWHDDENNALAAENNALTAQKIRIQYQPQPEAPVQSSSTTAQHKPAAQHKPPAQLEPVAEATAKALGAGEPKEAGNTNVPAPAPTGTGAAAPTKNTTTEEKKSAE